MDDDEEKVKRIAKKYGVEEGVAQEVYMYMGNVFDDVDNNEPIYLAQDAQRTLLHIEVEKADEFFVEMAEMWFD